MFSTRSAWPPAPRPRSSSANRSPTCCSSPLLAPLFAVFYNLHPLGQGSLLLLVLPLGTWALIINGTFFAALSLRTRNRELMLPLVLFPISIPALLAMVQATTNILTGDFEPNQWLKLLTGYDIVFTTVSLLLFETILNAE